MRIRLLDCSGRREPAALAAFLAAPPTHPAAERVARRVLEDVRRRGDRAVAEAAARFDGWRGGPDRFRVPDAELDAAAAAVDPAFARAAREARRRVLRFARAGRRRDWSIRTPGGGRLGERFAPLGRVGVYIPGGAAPLASTVVMTVPLAAAAGVPEIVACTPADPAGRVDPHILFALRLCGATEVYRVGGIQAVAAMAYGTATIRRVDRIVGPGGPFVAAAKRLVYGTVGIDMVAGPSEIAILADASADPAQVAADLLSQAEHGTGFERTLLVTDAPALARAVRAGLVRLAAGLGRRDALRRVLERRTVLAVVRDLAQGMDLVNRFAPEHLELLVRRPARWAARVRSAGAVFLGPWTPESAGDFVAGPSHVLPTGGTARFFGGLTIEDFRRRRSELQLARADLVAMRPAIETFSRVEGLPAHALSARLRLERS